MTEDFQEHLQWQDKLNYISHLTASMHHFHHTLTPPYLDHTLIHEDQNPSSLIHSSTQAHNTEQHFQPTTLTTHSSTLFSKFSPSCTTSLPKLLRLLTLGTNQIILPPRGPNDLSTACFARLGNGLLDVAVGVFFAWVGVHEEGFDWRWGGGGESCVWVFD
jgi:hypothetical protein